MVKLFRKNSNLCDHNPPTSQTDRQTDGQTDDMRSQDRALVSRDNKTKANKRQCPVSSARVQNPWKQKLERKGFAEQMGFKSGVKGW